MKKLIHFLFLVILSFAFLILPSVSEAQGRSGGRGGSLGGIAGRGGSPGGPGGGGGYPGGYGGGGAYHGGPGGGGYLGGVVGKGGSPGGYYGRHYGGPYRGYYGWGHHGGYYRGYYPYLGYYPSFYWGATIGVWPYPGWPYAYYGGWPYVGWSYHPPEVTEVPPADSQPAQQQPYYWYYCQDPEGYYPYVKSCPGGWIEVEPKPPRE